MKGKKRNISNKLLDKILKESSKSGVVCIEDYLLDNGYDKTLAKIIQEKLVSDKYAVHLNDGCNSVRLTADGLIFISNGGYKIKAIKDNIPNTTAIIGCITGTISFIWLVVQTILELIGII